MKDAGSSWKEKSSMNYTSCIKAAFTLAPQPRDKGFEVGNSILKQSVIIKSNTQGGPDYSPLPASSHINSAAAVFCIQNLGISHLLIGSYQAQTWASCREETTPQEVQTKEKLLRWYNNLGTISSTQFGFLKHISPGLCMTILQKISFKSVLVV